MHLISVLTLILFLTPAAIAQPMQPDRWNGVVPEGAAGFSAALYFNPVDGVALNLNCAGRGRGLGVFVQAMSHPSGQGAPGWQTFLRINGQDWPVGPGTPSGNVDLQAPWQGQQALLQQIAAGAPIELYALRTDGSGTPELLGEIPGKAADPGYAHVAADCGGGPPVKGAVETRDDFMNAPIAGSWQLRERGENYAAPIAVAWTLKPNGRESGGALGLFCDGAGQPAAYIFGYAAPRPDEMITVTLQVGAERFDFTAAPHSTDHVFRVSRRFVDAIRTQPRIDLTASHGAALHVDLAGAEAALAHAYANCAPPADF
ncbi:hypothetical protein [Actibacterium ureilyticum]|uniref:hypothetical protein n=1 Tax=Actibacterium ureilyticum TaxID=1590614 RepID=UPI000BAAD0CB|nr:hypothetical protein [Actibacterium ureilyticum]